MWSILGFNRQLFSVSPCFPFVLSALVGDQQVKVDLSPAQSLVALRKPVIPLRAVEPKCDPEETHTLKEAGDPLSGSVLGTKRSKGPSDGYGGQ